MKLISLVAMSGVMWSLQAVTLQQAQVALLENNVDLKIAKSESMISNSELAQVKSRYFPSLDLNGSYSYLTEQSTIALELGPPVGSIERKVGTNDKVELGLDISYPLFTGFTRNNSFKAAQMGFHAKEAGYESLKEQLSFSLGIRFLQWNLSHTQIAALGAQIQKLESYLAQTEELYNAGVVAKVKVLEARSRLSSVKADLVFAQTREDSLKRDFENFTGLTSDSLYPELADSLTDNISSIQFDTARASLEQFNYLKEQLKFNRKAVSGQSLPALFALAGYRLGKPGLNIGSEDFMHYAIAGVQLKWTIFDGFKTRSQKDALSFAIDKVQYQRIKYTDEMIKSYNDARALMNASKSQIDAAKISLDAARELVADLKNSLDAGVATSSDYINALSSEIASDLKYQEALTLRRIAILKYMYASGQHLDFNTLFR